MASADAEKRGPVLVIVLCGKRKSGKDHVAEILQRILPKKELSVVRLSKPLKEQYAKEQGLDAERLMDSSTYKETYRSDMIRWGEERRDCDPAHFCRLATAEVDKPVWLVCDARRPTDMDFFTSNYPTLTVKVCASEAVRRERGWVWKDGVDNAPSECALDNYSCQLLLSNNGDDVTLKQQLEEVQELVFSRLNLRLHSK